MRSFRSAIGGVLGFVLICVLASGCGTLLNQSVSPIPARLGEETQSTQDLKSLPPPKEPIVVAVYKFRDQTGQYKPSETGASWSTAVTQGATTILIKALEDSNWFVPIERENVGNLLNERKIIRSSRVQYQGEEASALPPLLYAGVILEGGVISYDANVVTGGAGLRYFGAGGNGQYRQDRVTIYLRAISTSNGQVLKTVYTSKTILSQSVGIGIFQFVKFSRLLEAETGFTYNEPSELAVTEAIEKAVQSLIIEGVMDELWELKEPRETVSRAFLDYNKEKELIPQTDIFGKKIDNRRARWGLGAGSSHLLYAGDYPDAKVGSGFGANIQINQSPRLGFSLNLDMSKLKTQQYYNSMVTTAELNARWRLLPYDIFTPLANFGLGGITENAESRFDLKGTWIPKFQAGLGFEYMVGNNIGLMGLADYNYIFSDQLDNIEQGKYNDYFWSFNLGINFYFGETLGDRKFN